MNDKGLNGNKSPEESAYSDYKHYYCRCCGEPCINRRAEPATKEKHCKRCYHVPDSAECGSRSAVHIVSGELKVSDRRERPKDGQKPGTGDRREPESPDCSSFRRERPEGSSVETTAIGDALSRLSYRRGADE